MVHLFQNSTAHSVTTCCVVIDAAILFAIIGIGNRRRGCCAVFVGLLFNFHRAEAADHAGIDSLHGLRHVQLHLWASRAVLDRNYRVFADHGLCVMLCFGSDRDWHAQLLAMSRMPYESR